MIREMKLKSRVDGLEISIAVVEPQQTPRAVLQFIHGMCGCKERFFPVMEYMATKGILCVAGDHRGHGGSVKTPDDLGYMYAGGYKALVDDMRMITDWTKSNYPDLPFYMLGHSMGSMAARVYVKGNDTALDGLVLCGSPSWNPMSYIGRAMAGLLCAIGLSRVRMNLTQKLTSDRYNKMFKDEGAQAWTCSDPESRRSAKENPLCNFCFTANGSYNLLSMMIETYGPGKWAVSNPELPVYFISGSDDPTMISERRFHQSVYKMCKRGYINVTSAIYPAMRHEVLNEIGKQDVWDDIVAFVLAE